MFNVLNKNRVNADSYEITTFIRDECGINKEEALENDFTPDNIKKISELLKIFFFQKRTNLTVVGGDTFNVQQVNIMENKKKYQMQLMEYLKQKLNNIRRNLAKCGKNTPGGIDEQVYEENSDLRIMHDFEIIHILVDLFEESEADELEARGQSTDQSSFINLNFPF